MFSMAMPILVSRRLILIQVPVFGPFRFPALLAFSAGRGKIGAVRGALQEAPSQARTPAMTGATGNGAHLNPFRVQEVGASCCPETLTRRSIMTVATETA